MAQDPQVYVGGRSFDPAQVFIDYNPDYREDRFCSSILGSLDTDGRTRYDRFVTFEEAGRDASYFSYLIGRAEGTQCAKVRFATSLQDAYAKRAREEDAAKAAAARRTNDTVDNSLIAKVSIASSVSLAAGAIAAFADRLNRFPIAFSGPLTPLQRLGRLGLGVFVAAAFASILFLSPGSEAAGSRD